MDLDARIVTIGQETPTVKSFLLEVEGGPFHFLPGQYADVIIDTGDEYLVGGFSMTSSPLTPQRIALAVKRSPERRISAYLHDRAKLGDTVMLMGPSGEFYYRSEMAGPLVLIAGGIGITPLMSMIRFVHEAQLEVDVTLIYSARSPSELVFRSELEDLAARNARLRCLFTVTRLTTEAWNGRVGRIDTVMLRDNVAPKDGLFYVCGPEGMGEAVLGMLSVIGVPESRIRTERW